MVTTNSAMAAGIEKSRGHAQARLRGGHRDLRRHDQQGPSRGDRVGAQGRRARAARRPAALRRRRAGGRARPSAAATCETLDVCGSGEARLRRQGRRRPRPSPAVTTAGEAYAPLFSCGAPTERAHLHSVAADRVRPATITATDQDGDTCPDATDVCPTVFDPARPLDQGKESRRRQRRQGRRLRSLPDRSRTPAPRRIPTTSTATAGPTASTTAPTSPTGTRPTRTRTARATPATRARSQSRLHGVRLHDQGGARSERSQPPRGRHGGRHVKGLYVTAVRPDTGGSRGFFVQDTTLQPFTGIFVFTASSPPGVAVGNKVDCHRHLRRVQRLSASSEPRPPGGGSRAPPCRSAHRHHQPGEHRHGRRQGRGLRVDAALASAPSPSRC